jgi:putative MATE family efflux protein
MTTAADAGGPELPEALPDPSVFHPVPRPALSRRDLHRSVLTLALPAIAEQLLFTVVQMAALMIVGTLGASAIAAVGVSNQIHWLLQSAFWAFGAGTTTLVAQFTGACEPDLAEGAIKQAVMFSLLVSVIVSSTGILLAPAVLALMGAESAVLTQAIGYLRMALVAAMFQSVSLCLSASLRGSGDTRTPFKVSSAGAVINVIIIWLLVPGRWGLPALGVTGVGVGLIASQAVVMATYLSVLLSGKCGVRIHSLGFKLDTVMLRRLLTVGIPAALEHFLMSFGMTVFTRLVMTLGTLPFAAHQISVNITSASFMAGFGFSMASTALVGKSLGARDPDLATDYARATTRLGVGTMAALGAVFFLFGSQLVRLYSADPQIIGLGGMILRLAAFAQPAMAFYSITAGALRGAGDTRYPLYITFAGMWTLRIGLAYFLVQSLELGLVGVWLAVNADQWLRAFLVLIRFRGGRWKLVKV